MSGEEQIRRALAGARETAAADEEDALWAACPIVCLGQRGGIYYFLSAAGELREFGVRDFSPNGLLSLFNGRREWLAAKFARHDKDGKPTEDFAVKTATAGLMRRCAQAGLWSAETPIRGIGVWRGDTPADPVIVHCGDVLMVIADSSSARDFLVAPALAAAPPTPLARAEGKQLKFVPAGRHWGRAIYPAAPEQARPAALPMDEAGARDILGALALWRYAAAAIPRLLLGFVALGALGEAPEWRVHALITAERGAGKSALARYIGALLGPQARAFNEFSEAGLRQAFTGEARAFILDEAEGDVANNRVEAVIQFLRRMSGDEGLQSVRGTASGHDRRFTAASPALLSAINPPVLMPQDRSRFLEIEMRQADAANRAKVLAAMSAAVTLSPAFRARAVAGWPRFRANLLLYHAALVEGGCDPRQADKFGALLAAADMMRFDDAADAEGVAGAVAEIADLIAETIAEDEEASDSRQCLATLMTRQIEHWRGGSKSTIGRLVYDALNDDDGNAAKALRVYGLRAELEKYTDGSGVKWWLFVANRHEGLSVVFRDTRWRAGAWKTALLRLPGALRSKAPIRFDGVKERAVQIPETYLPLAKRPPLGAAPAPNDDDPFGIGGEFPP